MIILGLVKTRRVTPTLVAKPEPKVVVPTVIAESAWAGMENRENRRVEAITVEIFLAKAGFIFTQFLILKNCFEADTRI